MEGGSSSEIRSDNLQEPFSSSERSSKGNSSWTLRNIIILVSVCVVYFMVFAAYSLYSPFFPSEARDKGVSGTIVGLIFGTYAFVIFVFSPFCGFLIPKYGPRFVMFSGIFLCGGSLILFGFCGMILDRNLFIVFCFVLRTTSAIGGAAAETSVFSILLERFPDKVGAVTGAVETFLGVGFSFGPVLGGVLYTVGGFKLPFIVIGSTMIAAIPVLVLTLSNGKGHKNSDDAEESTSMLKVLKIPSVFMLALCFAICGLSFSFPEPIIGPHLKEMGENATQIGLFFLVWAGVYALLAPVVGCIGDRTKYYRSMLVAGFTGYGVGGLLLGPAPFLPFLPAKKVWLVCVALLIYGLSGGFAFVPVMPDLIRTLRANGMPDNTSTNALVSSIYGCMYYLGFQLYQRPINWSKYRPLTAMWKGKRPLKPLNTKDKTQQSYNAKQMRIILLKVTEQTLKGAQRALPTCLHLYFVLYTFNYTPLGFIFLQFTMWGFFFLTTNPL